MSKQKNIFGLELMATHFFKELKTIVNDKGALLILVIAMIIYPIIYSVGYMNETLTDLPVGVVDLDHSSSSRKYMNMLNASAEINVDYNPTSLKQAEDLLLDNKISGIVLIPDDFEKELIAGKQTNVAVYADASYFLNYKNHYMAVIMANTDFNSQISVVNYMTEGKSLQEARVCANPLDIQTKLLYNPSSAYGTFIMPGLILVVLQQTLLIGMGLLGGSFSESKVSPFILPIEKRRREILPYLTGKTGAYIIISLLNVVLAVFLVHHWFQYPDKASVLHILMLIFPYLLAVIFLGIGVSTLFKHRESAIVFMVFLSPLALFFSGLSWPTSAMPEWIVQISQILPSTTAIPAYLRLRTMGVGIDAVKPELIKLYIQAGIYAAITILYFFLRIGIRKKRGAKNELVPFPI